MGIQGLSKVIYDNAPAATKENDIKNYFGRKVAIDASMSIYQFLIAVRSNDGQMLTNEAGETTSHLMGLFYRTIRMLENGIKPAYVFDGKPPSLKSGELQKRGEKRAEAQKEADAAEEAGDTENFDRFSRRTVKVTKEHNEECRKLLTLMGIPFVIAPCEAEAQCAALAKAGKVYAAGSEDMDTLTFGAPVLLRHLTFSEAKKAPIAEFHIDKVLAGLGMTQDEFIDLCILLGCDYCDSIRGIGPLRAVQLMKEHRSLENVLKAIDKKKYTVPEDWPYQEARKLFQKPDVTDPETLDLVWNEPDEEGIVEYMVKEKGFNEERIRKGVQKMQKLRGVGTQGRLDSFFKPVAKDPSAAPATTPKRKADSAAAGSAGARGKAAKKGSGSSRGKPRR
ncbi:PIN domain-like protein [Entophlyctis helioformis]|nr:PIN domain-like protein [Entophlyctis helioformis]